MGWSRRRRTTGRGSAASRRPASPAAPRRGSRRDVPRRRVVPSRQDPNRAAGPSARSADDTGRPDAAGSPDAGGTAARTARRARRRRSTRLTSRAAILGLVVCAMVLALAYPLREYLSQHSTIVHLEQQQQRMQHNVAALEHRRSQWHDPAFVKAQARKRLQYVMPGEVAYVVIGPKHAARSQSVATSHAVAPPHSVAGSPWYSQLWTTVRAADRK